MDIYFNKIRFQTGMTCVFETKSGVGSCVLNSEGSPEMNNWQVSTECSFGLSSLKLHRSESNLSIYSVLIHIVKPPDSPRNIFPREYIMKISYIRYKDIRASYIMGFFATKNIVQVCESTHRWKPYFFENVCVGAFATTEIWFLSRGTTLFI